MSGLSLQQGCIYLPVFPVHVLGLGEVVCAQMGGTRVYPAQGWDDARQLHWPLCSEQCLAWKIGDRHSKEHHQTLWFTVLCAPSKLALPPRWSKLSWCWRRLLTRLFLGAVGGTTCTYQLAICHSDWSLCNNDIVVINLVVFLVGKLAWALHYKPKRKPAAHLGRMPWKLCFVLHNVLLERIV